MGHAFFAPSSAPRVVECPGSLLLTDGMPDTQSMEAAQGTAAHWIADLSLRNKCRVDRYAGCIVFVQDDGRCGFCREGMEEETAQNAGCYTFEVDDEMVNSVQEYVDWCNDAPGDRYPEFRVDISDWCPTIPEDMIFLTPAAYEPQGGTTDHAACSPGLLVITDFKYGMLKVDAENNFQAVLYALGAMKEFDWLYDFKKIVIRICQPRLDHKDEWEITREELEAIGAYILQRFTLALQPDAPFNPGEKQCRFCRASGRCRAQKDYLDNISALAFDDLDGGAVDAALLSDEELVEAWKARGLYKARFDAIERELLRLLGDGRDVPGMKMVEGRAYRRWNSEDEAVAGLIASGLPRDKMYEPRSLISPAQAEKALPKDKREIIKTLAFKPRGAPVLADATDRRPAYGDARAAASSEVFDDLDDPFGDGT